MGLDLSDNSLRGVLPAEWGALGRLEGLWLHGNNLRGLLPAEWGELGRLESLWLHGNNLGWPLPAAWATEQPRVAVLGACGACCPPSGATCTTSKC